MAATMASLSKETEQKPNVSSQWKLLKSVINTDERATDTFPKVITHGIHHQGKIDMQNKPGQTLKFVALNSTLDRYATLDNQGKITVVTADGKMKRIKSDEYYKGMIFSTKSKQCICWGDSDKLKVSLWW